MKLSVWAKQQGVSYQTAWRWWKEGKLPATAPTGEVCFTTEMADWETVSEVGSGLNGRRPKLTKLLADMTVGAIVVEHRERLMRFGFEYGEAARARARSKTDCD